MKNTLFALAILTVSGIYAQEEIPPPPTQVVPATKTNNESDVVDFPDEEPAYPGGTTQMALYVKNNVKYPVEARKNKEQGKVYLTFIIEPTGDVSNVVVQRGVSPSIDAEAIRLIENMPKWTPGKAEGKAVRTRMRLPINFSL